MHLACFEVLLDFCPSLITVYIIACLVHSLFRFNGMRVRKQFVPIPVKLIVYSDQFLRKSNILHSRSIRLPALPLD